ncbi:MAG TPA: aminotransferase class V-fold PLP-dependent enzyme, partial [Anaerolineae bacterium]
MIGKTWLRSRWPGKSAWLISPPDWFSGPEQLRALAARLIGVETESVALIPSASYGIAIAAANVKVEPGQSIVLLDEQFPSNVYAWQILAKQHDATIRTVQRDPSGTWTQAVLEAIEPDTAVVAVSNCHWTDGSLIDLVEVSARARSMGAALVIDASQSLGAYPIDMARVQPDFLVSVGYKWLLGPYGLGYFYAAPGWCETGRPLENSWLSRAGSEDFVRLVDYEAAYRAGARRFDMGEFSQFVLVPMAAAALSRLLDWGIETIQASLAVLSGDIEQRALQLGGSALPAGQRVDHMIGIRLPGGLPAELSQRLAAENIFVSIRGDSIRVAPHVYNDPADVERFFAGIYFDNVRLLRQVKIV